MTDTIHTEHHTEQLTGRRLTNALTLLLSDLADAVDERFPTDGNPASTAYVQNYEAHRSAYGAVRSVLIALPAHAEFRAEVLEYVQRGLAMTHGDPNQDEPVRKCIERAADDYRPDTPDELRRTGKAARPVAAVTPAPKATGKS